MNKQSFLSASVVLALSAAPASGAIHLLSDAVKVDTHSSSKRSVVTITRTGKFYDPRYGEFELTQQMFDALVKNFNENVYGQEINIDIAHQPENGAGAVVRRLFTDRGRLRAEVEWYELGISKVTKEGFKYLSAEIHPNYVSNEQGQNGQYQEFDPINCYKLLANKIFGGTETMWGHIWGTKDSRQRKSPFFRTGFSVWCV
ncbi:hypothetical protein [Photobacterium halotolerans]|uniref:hypothetical protein n=1 Tax=Photobacterium halotolerans TaxID=265726 RepID=UPI00040219FD|nr:hypothetical protein [Photobacterium halotolerans]